MDNLRECPLCFKTDKVGIREIILGPKSCYIVGCARCSYSAAAFPDRESAITYWNKTGRKENDSKS